MSVQHVRKTILICCVVTAGAAALLLCSCSRGQQPSQAEIRAIVKEELASAKEKQTATTLREMLTTPDSQKYLQDEIKKLLQAPEIQKTLQDQLKKLLDAPEVKKTLQDAVREGLSKMLEAKPSGTQGGGGQGSTQ